MIAIKNNLKELGKLAFYLIPISLLLAIIGPVLVFLNFNSTFFSNIIWMKSVTIFMILMLFIGILCNALAERTKK
ncbi:TPA: hypothetical protein NR328_001757 [Listeria innocua]|uniref:hypothetical protein n=1 Tax=Listeria innocua TaxID=1642 RepID=UPI0017D96065|nr:hypothetical protein [Listeria innocua]EJG4854141.1 hypothetical protein [Listeria innocua]EKF1880581.1 hypothetical protein [Listeria innocua]EKJ8949409.1 hypothetical protein [Listeria innocua]EKJ9017958.1 hypothetical protein [Listeria innocua]HBM3486648.1 hypothetical protein [Listeria innocua]